MRFSALGTPGFYVSWLRPAIFVGGLETNLDQASIRTRAATVGAQVDMQVTFLSTLNMTLSVGGAIRIEPNVPNRRELMVSLALLK